MPTIILATAKVPYSGTPRPERDCFVNTFHFISNAPDTGVYADIVTRIAHYYCADAEDDVFGSDNTIQSWMSNLLDWSLMEVTLYDWGGSNWGTPIGVTHLDQSHDYGHSGNAPLPLEVAVCSSFGGNINPAGGTSTLPKQSRRGRRYLGPWQTRANASDGSFPAVFPEVKDTLRAIINTAEQKLITAGRSGDFAPIVFSKTHGGGVLVDAGWVDNDFDTQRRRGLPATERTSWSSPL